MMRPCKQAKEQGRNSRVPFIPIAKQLLGVEVAKQAEAVVAINIMMFPTKTQRTQRKYFSVFCVLAGNIFSSKIRLPSITIYFLK